jgi:hypothetical protein
VGSQEFRLRIPLSPPQKEFLLSPAKYTFMSGGFGSGKSHALAEKIIYRCVQNPGLRGQIIASDYSRLSRDVLPKLYELLDGHEIDHKWVPSAVPGTPSRELLIGEGFIDSRLLIGSCDQPDGLKGPSLAFIACEEASLLPRYVPGKAESVWAILVSRLRVPGGTLTIDLSGTPEGTANWTTDLWERAPDDASLVPGWRRDYRLIRASSWSNPCNPPGYVQSMIDAMDPTQRIEKIEGRPAAGIGGQCYYGFDVSRNVARLGYDPLRGPIVVAQDFNVDPACSLLCQFWNGTLLVFAEIVLQDSNTPEMARTLVSKVKGHGRQPGDCDVYPDAAGRSRQTSGTTDHAIMRAHGFTRLKFNHEGNPPVTDRINDVNGALYHGRVKIDPGCKMLIRDLTQVVRGPDGSIVKSKKHLTHLSDCLGYAISKLLPIRKVLARVG